MKMTIQPTEGTRMENKNESKRETAINVSIHYKIGTWQKYMI